MARSPHTPGPHQLAVCFFWASLLWAACACLLWTVSDEVLQQTMALLIRPNGALAGLACSLALAGILYPQTSFLGRFVPAAAATTAGALGTLTLLSLAWRVPLLPSALLHVQPRVRMLPMAPLMALGTLLTALALASALGASSGKRRHVATWSSLFCAVMSAGFVLSALFRLIEPSAPGPSQLMLPGAAISLLCVHISFLFSDPNQAVVREFVGEHPGAISARRLLALSGGALVLLSGLRVVLQNGGWVTLEEGTALMATTAVALLGAVIYGHARLTHLLLQNREDASHAERQLRHQAQALQLQLVAQQQHLESLRRVTHQFALIETDANGHIRSFSPGAEQLLGYSRAEAIGQAVDGLVHDRQELHERAVLLGVSADFDVFRALPNLGVDEQRNWTYVKKNGQRFSVSLTVTTLNDAAGKVVGYLGLARDISEQVKHQRERDGFFLVGQELLLITDAEGIIHTASPSFGRILGYSDAELLGLNFRHFLHSDEQAANEEAAAVLKGGGSLHRFENRWRSKDGRFRCISWDSTAPHSDGWCFSGGMDVTEEKQREQQRLKAIEFEQQLIGIVSHDLRNPITAISISAQLIGRASEQADKVRKHAQRIDGACKRAERLIHDVLDFTQARLGGGLLVSPSMCDMKPLVERTIEELQLTHPSRSIILQAPEQLAVMADADRIVQMLGNLLANSLKYSPAETPVTVRLGQKDSCCTLQVHNQGPPIAAELLPHLFKPLKRGASSSRNTQRNLGLGLYIVQEVVRAHRGRIEVQSFATSGTTFSISLPRGEQQALADKPS